VCSSDLDLRGLGDGNYRLDVLNSALVVQPGLGFDFDESVVDRHAITSWEEVS
jgi:2-oxoglutarate dehydrogenase complex dehydrogenase (E1) component-like enzyme